MNAISCRLLRLLTSEGTVKLIKPVTHGRKLLKNYAISNGWSEFAIKPTVITDKRRFK